MTVMTESRCPSDGCREVCLFLSDYCGSLLGHGATCIRMEKNVRRMAEAYGKQVEVTINPRHVHLSILNKDRSEVATAIAPVWPRGANFGMITKLSHLSWQVADTHPDIGWARREFRRLSEEKRQSRLVIILLVAMANMSFCRLFGGDVVAMAIVALATAAGYFVKQLLMERRADIRVVFLICSFISSILGSTDYLFSFGSTPGVAVGTSVLYLVPGVPFLNSFSDMLGRYYICAFSRLTDAMVLTVCLSAGLCASMWCMNVGMF